jgi:hypothetical protein
MSFADCGIGWGRNAAFFLLSSSFCLIQTIPGFPSSSVPPTFSILQNSSLKSASTFSSPFLLFFIAALFSFLLPIYSFPPQFSTMVFVASLQ